MIIVGKFQQYHHGTEKNLLLYNSPNPPEYNLSNVRANIHLMYGTNDWLTPSEVRCKFIVLIETRITGDKIMF